MPWISSVRRDVLLVLEAVKDVGDILRYASVDLRGDREVVLAAVSSDGLAIQYAVEHLRRDPKIISIAVAGTLDAWYFVPSDCKPENLPVEMVR